MNLSQEGFFRRSATVFSISRESPSSDTARASDIAPTSALKVRIALDLAARLSLPGNIPTINSRSFLTCSEVSARVRLSLREISGASALKAQPAPLDSCGAHRSSSRPKDLRTRSASWEDPACEPCRPPLEQQPQYKAPGKGASTFLQSGVVQLRGALSTSALSSNHSLNPDLYRQVGLSHPFRYPNTRFWPYITGNTECMVRRRHASEKGR
jgi:hypothetical protein